MEEMEDLNWVVEYFVVDFGWFLANAEVGKFKPCSLIEASKEAYRRESSFGILHYRIHNLVTEDIIPAVMLKTEIK